MEFTYENVIKVVAVLLFAVWGIAFASCCAREIQYKLVAYKKGDAK